MCTFLKTNLPSETILPKNAILPLSESIASLTTVQHHYNPLLILNRGFYRRISLFSTYVKLTIQQYERAAEENVETAEKYKKIINFKLPKQPKPSHT